MARSSIPPEAPDAVTEPTALVPVPRKPVKPPIEPLRQGDLDSLCGLYAIVNAIRLLKSEIDDDAAKALFRQLAKTLKRTLANPIAPLYHGIEPVLLQDLLITAREQTLRHLGLQLEVEPVVLWRKKPTLADLWDALRERLDGTQVAIIAIYGLKDHWTVAHSATDTIIRLFDSGDRHHLHRPRCTLQPTRTRFRLRRKEIFVLRRVT